MSSKGVRPAREACGSGQRSDRAVARELPNGDDTSIMQTESRRDGTRVGGKVAWVSGAGSGIGRSTAVLLAAEGAAVCCSDINADAAEATTAQINAAGSTAWAAQLDVTDETSWTQTAALMSERGGLDIAVHSAGISAGSPILETELSAWRQVMAVNLEGVFLGTKHAVAAMRSHGRRASIINVASLAGRRAQAGAAAYCASKAAVIQFSKAVALECKAAGDAIRINSVAPGGVKTPMWRSMPFFRDLIEAEGSEAQAFDAMTLGEAHNRFASPEEIAAVILFLASDESSYITATDLAVDLGGSA